MRKNKGSVTIEAAIALVVMIAAMLTLNIFIKVTLIHGLIQHSLIQTANEMATYDYVLSLLGVTEINNQVENQINTAEEEINNVTRAMETIQGIFTSEYKESGTDASGEVTVSKEENSQTSLNIGNFDLNFSGDTTINDAENYIKDLVEGFKDPNTGKLDFKNVITGFLKNILKSTAGEAGRKLKTYAINAITKAMLSTYINDDNNSQNKKLLDNYVVSCSKDDEGKLVKDDSKKGLDALNFSGSRYFEAPESELMKISCTYYIKVVSPIPIIEYVPMVNNVKVRAWIDDWEEVEVVEKEKDLDVWHKGLKESKDDKDDEANSMGYAEEIFNDVAVADIRRSEEFNKRSVFVRYVKGSKKAIGGKVFNFCYKENNKMSNSSDKSHIRSAISAKVDKMIGKADGNELEIKKIELYVYVPKQENAETGFNAKKLADERNKEEKDQNKEKIKELEELIKKEKDDIRQHNEYTQNAIDELKREKANDPEWKKYDIQIKLKKR